MDTVANLKGYPPPSSQVEVTRIQGRGYIPSKTTPLIDPISIHGTIVYIYLHEW